MTKALLASVLSYSDVYPKALANFLFREIIEDAHAKYNIPDEEIKSMCKRAVDRAALYIELIESRRTTAQMAFAIHAAGCAEWDDAERTEDIKRESDLLAECEKIIIETMKGK